MVPPDKLTDAGAGAKAEAEAEAGVGERMRRRVEADERCATRGQVRSREKKDHGMARERRGGRAKGIVRREYANDNSEPRGQLKGPAGRYINALLAEQFQLSAIYKEKYQIECPE